MSTIQARTAAVDSSAWDCPVSKTFPVMASPRRMAKAVRASGWGIPSPPTAAGRKRPSEGSHSNSSPYSLGASSSEISPITEFSSSGSGEGVAKALATRVSTFSSTPLRLALASEFILGGFGFADVHQALDHRLHGPLQAGQLDPGDLHGDLSILGALTLKGPQRMDVAAGLIDCPG